MSDLTTAPDVVPEICEKVDAPGYVEERATELAEIAGGIEGEHIGRTPLVIAAAAVYLVGLEEVPADARRSGPVRITQAQLQEETGVAPVSIRNCCDDIEEVAHVGRFRYLDNGSRTGY